MHALCKKKKRKCKKAKMKIKTKRVTSNSGDFFFNQGSFKTFVSVPLLLLQIIVASSNQII